MINIISHYKKNNSEVLLVQEGKDSFKVFVKYALELKSSARYKNYNNLDDAKYKYEEYVNSINTGICVFENYSRLCKADNCPKTLGGEDYWRLFHETCLYKTR